VRGMQVAEGVLTSRGGMVSHAAVVARSWGIPAVVGAPIEIQAESFRVGDVAVAAGDLLSIDGATGAITRGAHHMTAGESDEDLVTILSWADRLSGMDPTSASPEVRLQVAQQRLLDRMRNVSR
jgi:pyruvate, orthophosphate dikinase